MLTTRTTLFWRALFHLLTITSMQNNDVIAYLFPDITKYHNTVNSFNMLKLKRLHQRNKLHFYSSKAKATSNGKANKHDYSSSQLRSLSDVVGDHGLQILQIHNVPYDGDCLIHAVLHLLSCLEYCCDGFTSAETVGYGRLFDQIPRLGSVYRFSHRCT